MADRLIADCGSGGFYLDDCEGLLAAMERDPKPKILLGVSYALWDLADPTPPGSYGGDGDGRHEGVTARRFRKRGSSTESSATPSGSGRFIRNTAWPNSPRRPIRREATCSAARAGCASRHATSTTRSTRSRQGTRRAEHRGSGFLVVVRLYPDTGTWGASARTARSSSKAASTIPDIAAIFWYNEMPVEISAMHRSAECRSHGVPPCLNPPHP